MNDRHDSVVLASGWTITDVDALVPQPWKNGGGVTREVAAWPTGASFADFAWRVSIADVAQDGPFSAFDGIDRQITLWEGEGVHLLSDDGSIDHRLVECGAPFAFDGGTPLQATLRAGGIRDINVMTRRGRACATVTPLRRETGIVIASRDDDEAAMWMLLALRGTWQIQAGVEQHVLAQGGIAMRRGGPARLRCIPGDDEPAPIALSIQLGRDSRHSGSNP